MADEESQVEEETSWWAFEDFADSEMPSMSIDEPLEWPDSLPWEEYSSGAPADAPSLPPTPPADLIFPADDHAEGPGAPPPADQDLEWQPGGYDPDATVAAAPLAGLGGGVFEGIAAPAPVADVQPMPESIWSFDSSDRDDRVAGLTTLAAPLVYADLDGKGRGRWPRRFDIKRGNVAVVALISAVSLVLLGMFLSVRSRNDLPTDATASPPRTDQIATGNTRNSLPTTSVVSTTVPAAINIADLVPAADADGAGTTEGTGAGSGSGSGGGGTAVATTVPRQAAAPTGGGGGGGSPATTQPAPQSTATTAAPDPPASDTTTPTSPPAPPVNNTTATTQPAAPPASIAFPSIPDFPTPGPGPSVPGGSIPGGFPTIPGFPSIPTNNN